MKPSGRQRVLEVAAANAWERIGEAEWEALCKALPDVSITTIQRAGLAIDLPWSGVHQSNLDDLEASLNQFTAIYAQRPDLRKFCRRQVIAAKSRARGVARAASKRELKLEMVEWMLVWLSDPALFPAWATLRRRHLMI